jgi:hypothetical protein
MRKSRSKYIHIRVSSPKGAKTCRTHDIGRIGHSKRIACLKCPYRKKCHWYTQAFLVKKEDWAKGDPKAKRLVGRIMYAYPKAKLKAVGL